MSLITRLWAEIEQAANGADGGTADGSTANGNWAGGSRAGKCDAGRYDAGGRDAGGREAGRGRTAPHDRLVPPLLGLGLVAVLLLAILPAAVPTAPGEPALVIFAPWTSEQHAFGTLVREGGYPITQRMGLPLGLTGFVAAFPAGKPSSLIGIPIQILAALGCNPAPATSRAKDE